jgi:hypothetical protein
VFLFAHWNDIGKLFKKQTGATALVNFNTILVGSDHPYLVEAIRHELTHLLVGRWDWLTPPLLKEGLATWLQGSYWGQPINLAALPHVKDEKRRIASLLSGNVFYSDVHREACYLLAASFTGFLLQSYGWARYQKLYRRATRLDFERQFEKCIGTSLEIAESRWRQETISQTESSLCGS